MEGSRARVEAVRRAAGAAGFALSCDDDVGRLLGVLAAAVPVHGRILELGTGAGVGTAWLAHGLGARTDVELVTVEVDPVVSALARAQKWPAWVTFLVGDAVDLLPGLGRFDLVFADAPGGKWERLDLTVAALNPAGLVVVDDMHGQADWSDEQIANQERVRRALLDAPELVSCELHWASGVILGAKR